MRFFAPSKLRKFVAPMIFTTVWLGLLATTFWVECAGHGDQTKKVANVSEIPLVVLPSPPFQRATPKSGATAIRVTQLSMSPNGVTDEEEWFQRHNIKLREYAIEGAATSGERFFDAVPAGVPREYQGAPLTHAFVGDGHALLIYGKEPANFQYLMRYDLLEGTFRYAYDFGKYLRAPNKDAETEDFERQYGEGLVQQNIRWAIEEKGVLYVSSAHRTYAKSSLGMNAYVTAIDVKTNRIIWRSAPLVSNAETFEITNDAIVCGYGFTKEPDFLYVLDKRTGAIAQKIPLKTGPEYIIRKGDVLYVRAYDTDYTFRLEHN